MLKVLSYWNLNVLYSEFERELIELKVLSYWNLNGFFEDESIRYAFTLKYYHIGI